MRSNRQLAPFVAGLLLVAACAPTSPMVTPAAPTPAATSQPVATPEAAVRAATVPVTPMTISPLEQQLRTLAGDVRQFRQHVRKVEPAQRQQLADQLADLMAAEAGLLASMSPAIPKATHEQQQVLAAHMGRVHGTVQDMKGMMGPAGEMMPTPPPVANGMMAPSSDQIMGEMDQVREQMRTQAAQMDTVQLEMLVEHAADVLDATADIAGQVAPALEQLTPDQQQAVAGAVVKVQTTVQQMTETAQQVTPERAP